MCVLNQCIHFTFKNYEINRIAATALKSENSPANRPPHRSAADSQEEEMEKEVMEDEMHQELLLIRRKARHEELSVSFAPGWSSWPAQFLAVCGT